jgi:hypothetical protein
MSGSYIPSMVEKAKNLGDFTQTIKSKSSERASILSPAPQKSDKSPLIKQPNTKKESDDEYVDDEFDVDEEEESVAKKEVDFAISASASLLPPLAGQRVQDSYQSQSRGKGTDLKPEHFALNLADSNPSLDFDISMSRGFGNSGNEYGIG